MANKYDDQFDFDDLDVKPVKKNKDIKKNKIQDDDFFDLDDMIPNKNNKNNNNNKVKDNQININNKKQIKNKSKNTYDNYDEIYDQVQEIKSPQVQKGGKKTQKSNYTYQFDEIQQKKNVNNKLNLPTLNKPKKQQSQEEYQQEVFEYQSPVNNKKMPAITKKQEPQEEVYEEQVFDDYGDDFQAVQEQKPEKKISKITNKSQDKKLTLNTNKVFTNKQQQKPKIPPKNNNVSVPKPPQKQNTKVLTQASKKVIQPTISLQKINNQKRTLNKSSSKRSLHSNDSKKHLSNSRATTKKYTNTQFISNKHILLVQRKFPQTQDQISMYHFDKLNKMNDQIREMIRKFNQELNQLINKNMNLLKDKPNQKLPKIDDKVKVLQQQLKSGSTALQVVQNELSRLKGRQGQLRQEQYQLITQNKIQQCKENIKEINKAITHLKVIVNSQGNKLSKQENQKKMAQELYQIKIALMQVKKQQQKNQGKLQKLISMVEQLQGKNADKQYQMGQHVQNAKEKGIVLNIKQQLKKKHDELKAKTITIQNHKKVIQSLSNTKCQHIIHQIEQLRATYRSIQNQILINSQNIQNSQNQTIKEIKKAKENPKISSILSQNLDKVLKSIQENQALNFSQVRTQGNHSQHSQRPAKTVINQNKSKEKPPRNSSSKKDSKNFKKSVQSSPLNDEINLMKPNFIKKKQKTLQNSRQLDTKNPHYQRIWNEQDQQKKRLQQQKKKQQQQRQRLKKAQQLADQQKKNQPFNLKKFKKINNNEQKSFQNIPQSDKNQPTNDIKLQIPPILQKQNKQQQKVSIGPKFMRLNKKNDTNKIQLSIDKPVVEEPKIELKIQKKQAEEEVPFLPKRLNLRNKIQKKEQGYMPTIQKNIQIKPKQQPKQQKKQYTPNFSFKNEQLQKPTNVYQPKKLIQQPKLQISQDKPKFNLRLRDKMKKQTDNSYVPTSHMTQVQQDKLNKPKNDVYNPFNKEQMFQDEKPKLNVPKEKENQQYAPSFKRINDNKDKIVNIHLKDKSGQEQVNSFNKESQAINNPYAPKNNVSNQYSPSTVNNNAYNPSNNVNNNPYAPPVNNPYAPSVNNPYAPQQKQQNISNPYAPKPSNNPYAQASQSLKRQGPVKKIKVQNKAPKQKFNIYEQVQDITEPNKPVIQQVKKPQPAINLSKTNELDLNAMLGIKKKEKANDFDDLLGDVKIKKDNKKKNNDFFNDLEL